MISQSGRILALCGGVGGAKLALGLTETMAPEHLTIVVNTGDDFTHLGLHVSPDLDTVMYTLAGLANPETGWGRRDESWNFLAALEALGGETWFRLGDRDLATHVERTRRRAAGESLSQITADFHRRLGIRAEVLPMSDDPVRTMLETDAGRLAFQDYFVRRRAEPAVHHIEYAGCEQAGPCPGFRAALADPTLSAIIICPSNPWLSVMPILALTGVRDGLMQRSCPLVAVSPIVAGQAIKGPAARLMAQLGLEASAAAVAHFYGELLDGFVLDEADAGLAEGVKAAGVDVAVLPTIMTDTASKRALAAAVLQFARSLAKASLS